MRKNLFALLAALIFAGPTRSLVAAPTSASGHAWIAPVAGVFAAVGADRIATMGSPALTALSSLDSSARYPFSVNPQVLDLLAQNLEFYVTLKSFAAMTTEDKLIALRAAAKGAEIEASAIADNSLAEAKSRPLHPSSADQVSKQVAQAEEVSLYLDATRREEVTRMRSKVASFQSKWCKHVAKFQRELPLKIAAETFDASNILVKTRHGWVAADESPYPIGDDLSKFYERRTEALKQAPQGPWTRQEASFLAGALDRPEVGDEKSWAAPARLKLEDVIVSSRRRDMNDRPLMNAVLAFVQNERKGGFVAPGHIVAVEKRYEDALNSAWMVPAPIRLRILAAIRNGSEGLPSWKRFQEIKRATYGRTRRTALIAALVIAAGVISMICLAGSIQALPLAAKLAAVSLVWLAPLIVYVRGMWLVQKLESPRGVSIEEYLRRTFSND